MNSALLLRTASFAAHAHRKQRRKDPEGTPYINHPIGVADLIANVGGEDDIVVLQAALLHDTVEDTDVTLEQLKDEFGPEVAQVVAEVSDDKGLNKHERKLQQIEHAASASRRGKLVKLADKLYNLRDLKRQLPKHWSVKRAQAYFGWSREVINQVRGTNAALERELDKLFEGTMEVDGKEVPCIPPNYQDGDWTKDTPTE
ncbi:HD domain-containing protein 3 [Salpingoeca rosetta]|uniref:Guanosine-3',5'-bis(diphosphate) 3'-pyrophosphohydrolase MESH1 n=1 Tax=Salpingoeca rosetta (strain ATCC 50818 / BSB-021) TaxID=946362 RepID=F2U223_SALR5|nr:HD domain-containing protein 3 [Salpingoeca rosetta]EGD81675.1 HD domain-containing protein 3 [Salpingoeca rosetta]|eukprot:XP_004996879.1 HD domain-containing protein 3 [Salpingoeca rosetta]